jgi:minor extracellular protease Epr
MRLERKILILAGGLLLASASAAGAQLLGSTVPDLLDRVGSVGADAIGKVDRTLDGVQMTAKQLASARLTRLEALVRAHPDLLEMTDLGPAVRGEIIAVDPGTTTLAAARRAGFEVAAEESIEGLDIRTVTLLVPRGVSLKRAMTQLRRMAPEGEFTPNHLHLPSGGETVLSAGAAALAQVGGGAPAIGIIDGGVGAHPGIAGVQQRGFAAGAPAPSAHGTAVASLIAGGAGVRGVIPGAPLLVADIYGRDPKGGNANALARALGWMAERRVRVVAVSLVGPPNPLVAKAVSQAQARGLHVVAAVGNDGPAAPPAYPASYKGVIAVTGVNGRNKALPEAGRSLHLDYAAPGADMAAATPEGGLRAVRGTSYAVPFVAGRMARAIASGRNPVAALNVEAVDLGAKGPDKRYGRGLVCGDCRTPPPKK